MTGRGTGNIARFSANCSILFTELPLLERPEAARAAGFDAVEFWWPFDRPLPAVNEVDDFAHVVAKAGVQLVSLNLYGGDLTRGDRGIAAWPARAAEFAANLDVAIALAGRLGCTVLNVLHGRTLPDVDWIRQRTMALDNVRLAARAAASIGAKVVIEPLSGVSGYPVRTFAHALGIAEAVGEPNVAVLADLYHLSVNGEDVIELIRRHVGSIGHVQLADAPGRVEPGRGMLPIGEYLAALDSSGYRGRIGLEYVPDSHTELSLAWWERARAGTPR